MTGTNDGGTFIHSRRAVDKKKSGSAALLRRSVRILAGRMLGPGSATAMARGYEAMARLNLALAAEGQESLDEWPADGEGASEADPSGDP